MAFNCRLLVRWSLTRLQGQSPAHALRRTGLRRVGTQRRLRQHIYLARTGSIESLEVMADARFLDPPTILSKCRIRAWSFSLIRQDPPEELAKTEDERNHKTDWLILDNDAAPSA